MAQKKKALILLSGGLDSILAAKLLIKQKINLTALIFKSYFWQTKSAEKAARQLKIPLLIVDFSSKHLEIVKKPPHGYGKAANPCLDCHILMLKEARKIMKKGGYDFVATGEVLGERPFSQNKKALLLIAKESGLNDLLLRPLSARLLAPTLVEKKGWVKRKKLMAIQGRSRKKQIALAQKFKIPPYPQPAGGCLLTEKEFAPKLFNLLKRWPKANGQDVTLLRLGRHFWDKKTLIILGRNQNENEKLEKMKMKKDILITPKNFPGPTALVRTKGQKTSQAIKKAKELILGYSPKAKLIPLPQKPLVSRF